MRRISRGQADRRTQVIKLELRQQRLIAQVERGSALIMVIGSDPQSR